MKLLIDQNISHRVIPLVKDSYQDIFHVRDLELMNADDHVIFKFARQNVFDAIITCDDDFVRLLNIMGPPPKIIWLRLGNVSTGHIAEILNARHDVFKDFIEDQVLYLYEVLKV